MEVTDLIAWASMLGLGGALSALINWLIHRHEATATADSINVSTAESVVDLVNRQLDGLKAEVFQLQEEIYMLREQMVALSAALHAYGGDPAEVLQDLLDKTQYKRPH